MKSSHHQFFSEMRIRRETGSVRCRVMGWDLQNGVERTPILKVKSVDSQAFSLPSISRLSSFLGIPCFFPCSSHPSAEILHHYLYPLLCLACPAHSSDLGLEVIPWTGPFSSLRLCLSTLKCSSKQWSQLKSSIWFAVIHILHWNVSSLRLEIRSVCSCPMFST